MSGIKVDKKKKICMASEKQNSFVDLVTSYMPCPLAHAPLPLPPFYFSTDACQSLLEDIMNNLTLTSSSEKF